MTERSTNVLRARTAATTDPGLDSGSLGGRVTRAFLPVAFIIVVLVLWEFVSELGSVPEYILPAPTAIFARIIQSWSILWHSLLVTMSEVVIGFVIGVVLGFALAVPIAYSRLIRDTLYPLIIASQAVPKIAIAPLLVLWLGFELGPKIAVTALMVFFPVTVTAAEGLASVDPSLLDLLRSVHASPLQIFLRIRIPHALPQIFSGLKIGITLAVVGAVVGEWVGADSGLGYLLVYANTLLDSTLLFASLFLLIGLGVVSFIIVEFAERLLLPWHQGGDSVVLGG
ncbi:MAG TPA: ABC transporter permease [Candidatus Limnocylindrales bacterium]|nr:ABC transporter permease [Candidatus Limnocylindrales bacterium]